ncbi:MAG: dTDP-4-dehydrorhamnose 3,5-epimerase [Actinobacteria bacterium HGW-Actinobacteria-6]|jgi:dTDP-4-dehydrorhamnose 3,5-epimerase|nr:MAG: dTDP-4-dehydrorhamnose 3,5-epimerase [Actinobacteria bacterium HGW-Actinobacteria-6]
MRFARTEIPGLVEVITEPRLDGRGYFVKTFTRGDYGAAGLPVDFTEEFHSYSRAGVLRGLHFQRPPAAQGKLVFCEQGAIFDAVLDLRVGSPTYGTALSFELSGENGRGLYVPEGLAHGFCVLGDEALVAYKTTTEYSAEHDSGVHWDSAGIEWPVREPIVSGRDTLFAGLSDFSSPFTYNEAGNDE